MVKNKKFMVILVASVLSAALLTGCSTVGGGKTDLNGTSEVTDSREVKDNTTDQAETQTTATASGKLKAVDTAAGMITIDTESGDELVLKATDESKILIGGSLSTLAQLAVKLDSEVNVEYQVETKAVTGISIQD